MRRQSLAGPSQFRQAGSSDWLPASVPGAVHADLFALGRITDSFVSDNELLVRLVDGEALAQGADQVSDPPSSASMVSECDFSELGRLYARRGPVFVAALQGRERSNLACAALVLDKYLDLRPPQIFLSTAPFTNGGERATEIRVSAYTLARFVELEFQGVNVIFSDNFFDLPAGRELVVACPIPEG